MSLRVIGGKWRSRRLQLPSSETTRPMPDRVKQAVFDMLGSRYGTPGELPPLVVADLFAGSGSLGLESLSRGAAWCGFYEKNRPALTVLRENIVALDAQGSSKVFASDAWNMMECRPHGKPLDLIFLDPPYRDSEDVTPDGRVARFLDRFPRQSDHELTVVLHHSSRAHFTTASSATWIVDDHRLFGSSAMTFLVHRVP